MIQWGFSSGSGIGSYSSHSLHPSFHASQRPDSVNKAKNFFATFFLFFLPFFRVSTQFYFLACWQLHILNNEFAWSAIPSRRSLRCVPDEHTQMTKSFRREEVLTIVIILLTIGFVFMTCLLVVTECGRRKIWWVHRKWLSRNEITMRMTPYWLRKII